LGPLEPRRCAQSGVCWSFVHHQNPDVVAIYESPVARDWPRGPWRRQFQSCCDVFDMFISPGPVGAAG